VFRRWRRAGRRRRTAIAIDILPHPFSLLRRIFGARFTRIAWQVNHPDAGELRLYGSVDGTTAAITISMGGRPPVNEARIIAERGSVHCDLFHGFAVVEQGDVSRVQKIARPFSVGARQVLAATTNLGYRWARRESAYPGLRELVGRFYEAVAEGGPSPIGADETLAVAEARDVVAASSTHPAILHG
jgi:predicted dehydrogenase